MSNSGNKTDDQISRECPIIEALSMVSLEEPSSTIGESMEEESFPISMESEVADITNPASSVDKTFGKGFHPSHYSQSGRSSSFLLKEIFWDFQAKVPSFVLLCWSWPTSFSHRESPFLFLRLNSEMIGLNKNTGKLSLENSLCPLEYGRN